MTTTFSNHLLAGDHASLPAFGSVPQGTLYACSDHGKIYQSDGATAWSDWHGNNASSGLSDQGTFTYLDAAEAAAPATPAAGKVRIYAKADGRIYSMDDAGVESGPFDAAGGGGGGGFTGLEMAANGNAVSTVTLPRTPDDGSTIILFGNYVAGAGATGVSSTNTTWTKVLGPYNNGGCLMELWVGVVSTGGGAVITITHAGYTYSTLAAMELVGVSVTPTVGATYTAAASAATHTLNGVTSGNLVIVAVSNANTTVASSAPDVTPKGIGIVGLKASHPTQPLNIMPMIATFATGTSVSALITNATTSILMVELS